MRGQETNLGNLTADANTFVLQKALGASDGSFLVSLKNGGGIAPDRCCFQRGWLG